MFESMRKKAAAARADEEELYKKVLSELARGYRRDGLWGKALADSDGQYEKAKALYIRYRMQSLKDENELLRSGDSKEGGHEEKYGETGESVKSRMSQTDINQLEGYDEVSAGERDFAASWLYVFVALIVLVLVLLLA